MSWQEYYTNLEAEQSVLGTILNQPDLIENSILNDTDFASAEHQKIFEAMLKLKESNILPDMVSVSEQLHKDGELQNVGGMTHLMDLSRSVPSVAAFSHHQSIVKDKSVLRASMEALGALTKQRLNDPAAFAEGLQDISEVVMSTTKREGGLKHIKDGLYEHSEQMDKKANGEVKRGIPFVGVDSDKVIGMLQPQTLNILAARPSMGKTAAMLNIVRRVRQFRPEVGIAIFSLEQSDLQLYDRLVAAEANIQSDVLKEATLTSEEWQRYTDALGYFASGNIYISDMTGQTIQTVRQEVKEFKKKFDEIVVLIDYLQLVETSVKKESREKEVADTSKKLKQMARENNCPVVALAQLSRSVEQRQDKRPMMSDLRESGGIEQDADTVTFIYRDEYYNPHSEKKGIAEFITAKNREGSIGTAEMVFMNKFVKFVDHERVHSDMFT